jgi:hypothetical protein
LDGSLVSIESKRFQKDNHATPKAILDVQGNQDIAGVAIDDLFTAITPRLAELQNPNNVYFTDG